jgi:D-beta-D-heptose 7-phosphate kinase/D-beta-D-heptose 1-phosphate adenosyltransferase
VISLGGSVELCELIGDNSSGARLQTFFSDGSVQFSEWFVKRCVEPIAKMHIVLRGQQLRRVDCKRVKPMSALDCAEDLDYIESRIDGSDAVILSDYNKGTFTDENISPLAEYTRGRRKFVAIDVKPSNQIPFSDASIMIPNRFEAVQLAGLDSSDACQIEEICRRVLDK